jgi:hypothetical protein
VEDVEAHPNDPKQDSMLSEVWKCLHCLHYDTNDSRRYRATSRASARCPSSHPLSPPQTSHHVRNAPKTILEGVGVSASSARVCSISFSGSPALARPNPRRKNSSLPFPGRVLASCQREDASQVGLERSWRGWGLKADRGAYPRCRSAPQARHSAAPRPTRRKSRATAACSACQHRNSPADDKRH